MRRKAPGITARCLVVAPTVGPLGHGSRPDDVSGQATGLHNPGAR